MSWKAYTEKTSQTEKVTNLHTIAPPRRRRIPLLWAIDAKSTHTHTHREREREREREKEREKHREGDEKEGRG